MYIGFEGHDGSGKSTTCAELAKKLRKQGKDVLEIRAPGSTPFGQYLRSTWHPNPVVRQLQLLANHVEIIDEVVKPALAADKFVLQDRTYVSSLVYSFDDIFPYAAQSLVYDFINLRPDVTFFFHCDADLAIDRLTKLDKDLPDPDQEALASIQQRYQIEYSVVKSQAVAHMINSNQDLETVVNECLSILSSLE